MQRKWLIALAAFALLSFPAQAGQLTGPLLWNLEAGEHEWAQSHDWEVPVGVRRITINFGATSLTNDEDVIVRLITASGVVDSGYASSGLIHLANRGHHKPYISTTGFIIPVGNRRLGMHGRMTIVMLGEITNSWTETFSLTYAGSASGTTGAGSVQLTDPLTAVRVESTRRGLFDNGRVTLYYERAAVNIPKDITE